MLSLRYSVQEFGWGMPSQCSVFRKGCRVLGGEFDFHRSGGLAPIVNTLDSGKSRRNRAAKVGFKKDTPLNETDIALPQYTLSRPVECKELEKGDRASCIMACATGKTYVALWTLHALWTIQERPDKTLVFVPSLALLAQILDDWRKEGALFKYLCVCSDQTVDKESGDIKPADCGLRVTTEPGKVRQFLDSADDLPKIVLSTYQSSPVIKEALAMRGDGFDLGIFDEAHKTAGRLGRNYSLGLSDCEIPIKDRFKDPVH